MMTDKINMIEKVAKSIFCAFKSNAEDEGKINLKEWDELNNEGKQVGYKVAKIVIAAMREPTEEMIEAGDIYCANSSMMEWDSNGIYQAMIDIALKE